MTQSGTKLTCPDCGGVLGVPEPGERACECFKHGPRADFDDASNGSRAARADDSSDTQRIEYDAEGNPTPVSAGGSVAGMRGPRVSSMIESDEDHDAHDHGGSKSAGTATSKPPRQKLCFVCGKDVSGHRRYKDSRGYMCHACNKLEEERKIAGTVACDECGRRLRPQGLFPYRGGIRICKNCLEGHKDEVGVKKVSTMHYEAHERRSLLFTALVALFLLALMIYSWYKSTH